MSGPFSDLQLSVEESEDDPELDYVDEEFDDDDFLDDEMVEDNE